MSALKFKKAIAINQSRGAGSTSRLWDISASGVWAEDNAKGRECADILADQMVAEDQPQLLGHVVRCIVQEGRFGGVEVGFFHRLAERVRG